MIPLTRRYFLKWIIGCPLFPLFAHPVSGDGAFSAALRDEPQPSIGAFFDGEELTYEIGFWIIHRVALGTLGFKEVKGRKGLFLATLQAESVGFPGWAVGYRVDTYRSTMEEIDAGRRLRSLTFEEAVKVGTKLRRRVHLFDHQRQRWVVRRQRSDGTTTAKEETIPSGMVYDDFLTASYNFRYGVYGLVERGKVFKVPTFPRKGASSYEVRVVTKEEEQRRKTAEKSKEGKDFFLRLRLDPEVTHSKEGWVEGWLSRDLYPVEGKIKDVILFGDLRGSLIQRVKRPVG